MGNILKYNTKNNSNNDDDNRNSNNNNNFNNNNNLDLLNNLTNTSHSNCLCCETRQHETRRNFENR